MTPPYVLLIKMFGVSGGYPANASQHVLWFWRDYDKLHVDGGGVQAEVVDDVLAGNGIIYSIDRVKFAIMLESSRD